MKIAPLFILFSLFVLTACQETTKIKKVNSSQDNYCVNNPYAYGCSGTTGGTTGSNNEYCTYYPYLAECQGTNTNGGTNGGGTTGGSNQNPYPNYGSYYVDKNWQVKYPYVPSLNCSTPVKPSGIDYTPYETRKGTITVVGAGFGNGKNPNDPKSWYDPNTYIPLASGDSTSERLRTVEEAKKFFWTDSTLKVRFKANLQPDSSQSNPVCYGRVPSMAWIKGYTKLRFQLYLVGLKNGTSTEEYLGEHTIDINKCSTPLNLANYNGINYTSKYPEGIYLKIKNVRGNQNWSPGTWKEQEAFDTWGFYPNSSYNGESFMPAIRSNDCWSLDIEVAADGTKTF
jgi:hypothetical protein